MRIKNRTIYDSIYQCLVYCHENETSPTMPNTMSKFFQVISGNYTYFRKIFDEWLITPGLIEVNPNVEHYVTVYRVTEKGKQYIDYYRKLMGLLGKKI